MRAYVLSLVLLAAGCAASTTEVRPVVDLPVVREVTAANVARVSFRKQAGNVLSFDVFSLGPPLVIDRDQVFLVRADARIPRLPGGLARIYNVPPGSAHDVNVAYDLRDYRRGDMIAIDFSPAVLLNGQPVALPPIQIPVEP